MTTLDPKVEYPTPEQIRQFEEFVLRRKGPAIAEAQERERDAALDADYQRFAATMTPADWLLRQTIVAELRATQSKREVERRLGITLWFYLDKFEIGDTEWITTAAARNFTRKHRHFCHSPTGI